MHKVNYFIFSNLYFITVQLIHCTSTSSSRSFDFKMSKFVQLTNTKLMSKIIFHREESLALETQLEADRKLALQIEHEWATEENKKRKRSSTMKADYNLRKKGKRNLRKKVLMGRRQTTLDTMLIK